MSKARVTAQKSVTSSVTPSSKSGHFWSFDEDGNICINIENCVTGEDLKIPAPESVVTGIKFPGDDEIYAPDENGCITLPADKFSTGELSEDGTTLTVIMDGLDMPVDICLDPVKGAVIIDENDDVITEIPVVDGILQLPDLSQCWGYDDNGDIVTNIPNCITGELLVICGNPVKEVSQGDDGVTTVSYADGEEEEIQPSYAESNGNGTTTTYHPDDSSNTTCDLQFKEVREDAATGEMVAYSIDQDGNEVEVGRWFNAAPTNRTKVQLAPADGQVTDGNGDAVPATSISGELIVAGDRVIVECDEDGNVVRVMTNALPKDCVLTIHGESPDSQGNINPAQSTASYNGDGTTTLQTPEGDPCILSSEKETLEQTDPNCLRFRSTDLKTGASTDSELFASNYTLLKAAYVADSGLVNQIIFDDTSPDSSVVVFSSYEVTPIGCLGTVQDIHIQSDNSMTIHGPIGQATSAALSTSFRVNGGAWRVLNLAGFHNMTKPQSISFAEETTGGINQFFAAAQVPLTIEFGWELKSSLLNAGDFIKAQGSSVFLSQSYVSAV